MARVRNLRLQDIPASAGWAFVPSVGILAKDLDTLGHDISNFHEPLKKSVQNVMIPSIRKNFDEGGRPPWPDLSPATMSIREIDGYPDPTPLVKTGLLRTEMGRWDIWRITETAASLQDIPQQVWYGKVHQAGYGGRGNTAIGDKYSIAVGTKDEDLDIQSIVAAARGSAAAGTGRPVAAIPQRQFVLFQDDDFDAIEEIFSHWLDEQIAKDWG